jgi:hypothetical protein
MVDMCATQEHHLETIAGPILLSHPQQGKQRYYSPLSQTLQEEEEEESGLSWNQSLLVVAACQVVERYVQFTLFVGMCSLH